MPRPPRIHVAGGIYHVTLRGNHGQAIFHEEANRGLFEDLLAASLARYGCALLAYCWMSNHIHAALQVGDVPLGEFMRHLASRYARRIQRRVPTTGHLFERRYHSGFVDSDEYLMAVVRYIHLNPVRAGLVVDPVDYPWSSHRAYLGLADVDWVRTDVGLRLFGPQLGAARQSFRRFVDATPGEDEISRIRQGQQLPGRDANATSRVVPGLPSTPDPEGRAEALERFIECRAAQMEVPTAELAGPSRARVLSHARALIAHAAIRARLGTLTELAARFNRTPATLWACMQRHGPDAAPPSCGPILK